MTAQENIERRLARIESRLVQLMIHMGIDPYERAYDNLSSAKHTKSANADTQSKPKAERGSKAGTARRNRIRDIFTRPLFS